MAKKAEHEIETIRRIYYGDLVKLFRHRYGSELPDDDAGRESLLDLLVIASLAMVDPAKKMANLAGLYAPWLNGGKIIDIVNSMPRSERWRIITALGERHRVTYAEGQRMRLRNLTHATRPPRSLPHSVGREGASARGSGDGSAARSRLPTISTGSPTRPARQSHGSMKTRLAARRPTTGAKQKRGNGMLTIRQRALLVLCRRLTAEGRHQDASQVMESIHEIECQKRETTLVAEAQRRETALVADKSLLGGARTWSHPRSPEGDATNTEEFCVA